MKFLVKMLCIVMVFAMMAGICSCDKFWDPDADDSSGGKVQEEVTYLTGPPPEVFTEPTIADLNNYRSGDLESPMIIDLVDLGVSCMGMDADSCLKHLESAFGFMETDSWHDQNEGFFSFKGGSITCCSVSFKSIHLYLKDGKVVETDYCITDGRSFSNGAEGGLDLGTEANLPAETYYQSIWFELDCILNNAYKGCNTFWLMPESGKSLVWKLDDTWIAATYGNACFGVPGNNLFELAVSTIPDFEPSCNCVQPTSDVPDSGLDKVVEFGRSIIGKDVDTAETMTEQFFGIDLGKRKYNINSNEHTYGDFEIEISGVKFNKLTIFFNMRTDEVYEISFEGVEGPKKLATEQATEYYKKLSAYYGSLKSYSDDGYCNEYEDGYMIRVFDGGDVEPTRMTLQLVKESIMYN